jgi:hypothetical protein
MPVNRADCQIGIGKNNRTPIARSGAVRENGRISAGQAVDRIPQQPGEKLLRRLARSQNEFSGGLQIQAEMVVRPATESGKVRAMTSRLKTIMCFASLLTISFSMTGCKSRQTRSASSAPPPPATADRSNQFYRGSSSLESRSPRPLPSGPSRLLESPTYDDSTRTSVPGRNLPLPAPPVED